MSSSGITPINLGAHTPAQTGSVVQIVSLPEGLQNVSRAMRVQGEVVQQNQDGSTRIKTPEGNIDVMIRGRQPQEGARIEVDIPAGSPPRNATLRPAPQAPAQPPPTGTTPPAPQTAPQQPVPTSAPAQGQSPQQPSSAPQTGGTAQPLPQTPVAQNGQTQPTQPSPTPTSPQVPAQAATPQPAQLPPLPALQPGATVTLTPQPAMAATTPQALPEMSSPVLTTTAKVEAQTQVVPEKAQGNLISTLLQAVKTALPDSPALQSVNNFFTGNTAKPANAATLPMQPQPVLNIPLPTLTAKVLGLVLPSGQILGTPQIITTAAETAMKGQSVFYTAPQPQTPSPRTHTQTPQIPLLNVTIAEVTAQNQPIVTIPMNNAGTIAQDFVLQSPPATVPVGTQITLQPMMTTKPDGMVVSQLSIPTPTIPTVTPSIPATTLPPAWRALVPLMQPTSLWPLVDDVFQSFYQATPQAAQILARTIPSPANPSNFGPSLLLFAAAMKAGDLQGWLGDKKLEMIQKIGKGDLVSRLSRETAAMTSDVDAAPTDWKSFPVPLHWQNEISKVLFHVRQEPQDKDNPDQETGTRFVLDIALSRMGDVQLDGIVRGKRLDIIVRTQMPVSIPMQDAMKLAYANALDGTDVYGELGFQGDMKQWMVVKRDEGVTAVSV